MNVGIIQSFEVKQKKEVLHYVLAWIPDDRCASETENAVYILQAIQWIVNSLKGGSDNSSKNHFANVMS